MNLAYYIFILLIIFLLILLIKKNLKLSPKKIRIYITVVGILFIIRYVGLFLLCILKNAEFIYLLTPILFLNHITIPLMVIGLSYVYLRWDKLSFSINYIAAAALCVIYLIEIYLIKERIHLDINYGYVIEVVNKNMIYLIPLIIAGVLLIFSVYFIDKPNSNKAGMIYLILGLFIVIMENVLYLGGIKIFPYPIIGDGIFILIMNLAIDTFKKNIKGIL